MAKTIDLIFKGLTEEQAITLADWFEGQGEQDCGIWFDDRNVPSPLTDVQRKGGYMEKTKDAVIVHCRTPKPSTGGLICGQGEEHG